MKDDRRGKPTLAQEPTGATSIMERRRIGRVVHDERGNAHLEWVNAPVDSERTPLSIEDSEPGLRPEGGYDPYQKPAKARVSAEPDRSKRDLRKLSEWIKQKREFEARKQRGDDGDED